MYIGGTYIFALVKWDSNEYQ